MAGINIFDVILRILFIGPSSTTRASVDWKCAKKLLMDKHVFITLGKWSCHLASSSSFLLSSIYLNLWNAGNAIIFFCINQACQTNVAVKCKQMLHAR